MSRAIKQVIKASVSEIIGQLLGESYAPREILEENRLLHHKLGLDGGQEYSVIIGGLKAFEDNGRNASRPQYLMLETPILLTFKPDAVRGEVVYELKVLRRYSDRERLMLQGFIQLQLELYALGLERGKLLLYHYDDGRLEEHDMTLDRKVAEKILAWWIQSRRIREDLISHLAFKMMEAVRTE